MHATPQDARARSDDRPANDLERREASRPEQRRDRAWRRWAAQTAAPSRRRWRRAGTFGIESG
jgi:hypothetical protein